MNDEVQITDRVLQDDDIEKHTGQKNKLLHAAPKHIEEMHTTLSIGMDLKIRKTL